MDTRGRTATKRKRVKTTYIFCRRCGDSAFSFHSMCVTLCFDLQSLIVYHRDVFVSFHIGQINEDEHRQLNELINRIIVKGLKCEEIGL